MKTPDYVTVEDVRLYIDIHDSRMLPKGSFVRPIEIAYVPKHIINDERYKIFDKSTWVYVYCRYGIFPIPKESIRQT